MTLVYLGLGSNLEPETNIRLGIERIREHYTILQQSPSYRSPAMGFSGPDFINLVLLIECNDELPELLRLLKEVEADFGRAPNAVKFSSRYLDIDVLLFGELSGEHSGITLPRQDIRQYAYALRPLLDISPDLIDPHTGDCIASYLPAVANQIIEQL